LEQIPGPSSLGANSRTFITWSKFYDPDPEKIKNFFQINNILKKKVVLLLYFFFIGWWWGYWWEKILLNPKN